MNATGLLVLEASMKRRRELVQRPGTWREKAEGVVMRTAYRQSADHSIRALRTETQGPSSMPPLLRLTKDHRPFMQTKTAEERRASDDRTAKA